MYSSSAVIKGEVFQIPTEQTTLVFLWALGAFLRGIHSPNNEHQRRNIYYILPLMKNKVRKT